MDSFLHLKIPTGEDMGHELLKVLTTDTVIMPAVNNNNNINDNNSKKEISKNVNIITSIKSLSREILKRETQCDLIKAASTLPVNIQTNSSTKLLGLSNEGQQQENNPKRKLYCLIPKLIRPDKNSTNKRMREPRFIPIEPYKCSVNPIVPAKKSSFKMKRNQRNNLDINMLVTQMSNLKTTVELNSSDDSNSTVLLSNGTKMKNNDLRKQNEYELEKKMHLKEIENLKNERDQFKDEFKHQRKVNTELKKLLISALTEDTELKVNALTEDKIQLAKALDDTVQNLSKHAEQIEQLAGQCEVWRSKFLASSVMIEELAKWKATLSYKNTLLSESNKKMLQLTAHIREMQLNLLENLKQIAKEEDLNVPITDIITLNTECLNIAKCLMERSSNCSEPQKIHLIHSEINSLTEAEKTAIKAIEISNQPLVNINDTTNKIHSYNFNKPEPNDSVQQNANKIFTISTYKSNYGKS